MKKKIAVVLCFIMVAMSLAGCSQVELDYLNLSKELSSESYKMSGTMTGEIDFDALTLLINDAKKQFVASELQETDKTAAVEAIATEDLFGPEMKGIKKIEINYTGLANISENIVLQLDCDVQFNGKAYDMGDMYFDVSQGAYISKQMMLGAYELYKDMTPGVYSSYFYGEDYKNELVKVFGNNEYIHAGYFNDMSNEEKSQMTSIMSGAYNKQINEGAFNFIENVFDGFTTGTVSRIGGGFQIACDGQQGKKLIADMLQHFIDNIDKTMLAYKNYTLVTLDNMHGIPEGEVAEAKTEIEKMFAEENKVVASMLLSSAKQAFIDADKAGKLDFLNGFNYKATVKKNAGNYSVQENATLKTGNKAVISLKSTGEVTLQPVTITLPTDVLELDKVKKGIDGIENEHNPVQSATIEWWNDSGEDNWAIIKYARDKKSPLAEKTSFDLNEYFIKDKNVYLPLRTISEKFGEAVAWDQTSKKAYIVRDNKQIELTGILKDGTTYVKVRDFEKLGYEVSYSYDKEAKMHTAKIGR